MYGWKNFKQKMKKYGTPDTKEVKGLLITTIVFAFILSFREWGADQFDLGFGVQSYLISFLFVVIALFIYELSNRTLAVMMGYQVKFKTWIPGLLISLLFTFLSNGYLPLLLISGITIKHLKIHRLGMGFYELSMKHAGWIPMTGSIALMIFAVMLKPFSEIELIFSLMKICILISIFNMLPIPPMNGLRTFFGSRYIYVFVIGCLIGCAALLMLVSGIVAIILSILIGAVLLLVFWVNVDKRW